MHILQQIWQNIAPNKLKKYIRFLLESGVHKERRLSVLNYYRDFDRKRLSPEIQEGLEYLRNNKFSAYPYKWAIKYENWIPRVYLDESSQCFYILFEGKKMFFPRRYTKKEVIWIVRSIYKEQDEKSPHLYLTKDFQIDTDSIVIDAGVAEGNFALSVIENTKKLYLVECDLEWIEALKLTFLPWKHKVIFVEKYMSDLEDKNSISIDKLIGESENESYFIKMDIEGYEQLALKGMKHLIESKNRVKMDICTYHKPNDFEEIKSFLNENGFNFQVSDSFMLFYTSNDLPEFRKVLIRAWKNY